MWCRGSGVRSLGLRSFGFPYSLACAIRTPFTDGFRAVAALRWRVRRVSLLFRFTTDDGTEAPPLRGEWSKRLRRMPSCSDFAITGPERLPIQPLPAFMYLDYYNKPPKLRIMIKPCMNASQRGVPGADAAPMARGSLSWCI